MLYIGRQSLALVTCHRLPVPFNAIFLFGGKIYYRKVPCSSMMNISAVPLDETVPNLGLDHKKGGLWEVRGPQGPSGDGAARKVYEIAIPLGYEPVARTRMS